MITSINNDSAILSMPNDAWTLNTLDDATAKKIGSGAFGSVYVVEAADGEKKALKVFKNLSTEKLQSESLFHEGESTAVLFTHKNIAQVTSMQITFDSSKDEKIFQEYDQPDLEETQLQHLFLQNMTGKVEKVVLELLNGPSLQEAFRSLGAELKSRPSFTLPLNPTLKYMGQAAEALEFIHSKGFIHRDIKTGNMMLTGPYGDPETQLKLIDFGLAIHKSHPKITELVGTPHSLSPEMCSKKSGTLVSGKVDTWALGTVIGDLITGKHTFQGKSLPALIMNIMKNEKGEVLTTQFRERYPEATPVSRLFATVVHGALQTDPAKRFSANQLKDALDMLQSNLSILHVRSKKEALERLELEALFSSNVNYNLSASPTDYTPPSPVASKPSSPKRH